MHCTAKRCHERMAFPLDTTGFSQLAHTVGHELLTWGHSRISISFAFLYIYYWDPCIFLLFSNSTSNQVGTAVLDHISNR